VAVHERVLGKEHPATCGSVSNLADVLREKGDAAATGLYDSALAGLRKTFADSHPDVLAVLYEYSLCLQRQRRVSDARRLALQLVSGAKRSLPKNHPDRLKYEKHLQSLR
jgi:hypothetical protein